MIWRAKIVQMVQIVEYCVKTTYNFSEKNTRGHKFAIDIKERKKDTITSVTILASE